ncbi:MAG: type III pantothenate kinase [Thermoleophilia bacterium]
MLLAVDIGNTQTVLGLFQGESLSHHWRMATEAHRSADELAVFINGFLGLAEVTRSEVDGFVLASVVPLLTGEYERMCRRHFGLEPLIVGPGVRTGMPIRTSNPDEVGPDLIADAVAAYAFYGGPAVVVDFGTATTVGAVSERGEYLGTAIAPGIRVSLEALIARAARLRTVELADPGTVIGKSTAHSLRAGVVYGFAGQVDGLVRRMKAELGGTVAVVATGGLSSLVVLHCETVEHEDPYLTLRGLRLIAERNG